MSYKDFLLKMIAKIKYIKPMSLGSGQYIALELRIDLMILPNSQTNQYGKNNFLK